jgi:hypothetical protein
LLAALAAGAAVGLPVGAFAAGRRLSSPFGAAVADPVVVRSLALGFAATGLVAGIALALLTPGPAALGRQLAAAPVPRSTLVFATSFAPMGCAAAVAAVPALLFSVPLAGARTAPALLALAAAVSVGAAGAEGGRVLAGGDLAGLVALGGAGVAWVVPALAWGEGAETGPLAAFVVSLPHGAVAVPSLCAACTAVAGIALWLAAAVRRGPPRSRGVPSTVVVPVPRAARAAVAATTLKRIGRRSELRAHLFATTALTVAAAYALAFALHVRGEALLGFVAGLGLTAVAVLPSVALGLLHEQSWLVASAPSGRRGSAAAAGAAGMLAGAVLLVALCVLSAPVARGDPGTLLQLESAAAFVLGCGAIAGALVPWRADRVLQQLAAYGALLAVVLVLWLAIGRAGRELLSADVLAVVAGNLVAVAGVLAAAASAR